MSRPHFPDNVARRAAVEMLAMTALLLSYIWVWAGRLPAHRALLLVLYFGLGVSAHRARGETARAIGLRKDNWREAARLALLAVGPLFAAVWLSGWAVGSARLPAPEHVAAALLWRLLWGTAQQYGLVCFYYRRALELTGSPGRASWLAAALFALFHLPNVFLTAFTFGAGWLACWIYRRAPNVAVLGAAHALVSFAIYYALPETWTVRMRVGPGFYDLWRELSAALAPPFTG